jgi:hypothetical protein
MTNAPLVYAKEYWTGDSRDGRLVNGDGYHYYQMAPNGEILDAYEFYESEDGTEVVSPLPEMVHVNWITDLGFEDMEILDPVTESEFDHIKNLMKSRP